MNYATAHPVRLSRAETKENTHRLLLDAAERVFVRLGYQGATLDAIAAEAGFTKGAVYWHFRNKEALFLELLAEGLRRHFEDLDQLLTVVEQNPKIMDDVLGRWVDQIDTRDHLPLLGVEMDLESRRNSSFAVLLDAINLKHHRAIGHIMERYFDLSGRKPPMPVEELAASLIALSKAIALARQTHHSATLTSAKLIRVVMGLPVTS